MTTMTKRRVGLGVSRRSLLPALPRCSVLHRILETLCPPLPRPSGGRPGCPEERFARRGVRPEDEGVVRGMLEVPDFHLSLLSVAVYVVQGVMQGGQVRGGDERRGNWSARVGMHGRGIQLPGERSCGTYG